MDGEQRHGVEGNDSACARWQRGEREVGRLGRARAGPGGLRMGKTEKGKGGLALANYAAKVGCVEEGR
jgi:hypothetical protein